MGMQMLRQALCRGVACKSSSSSSYLLSRSARPKCTGGNDCETSWKFGRSVHNSAIGARWAVDGGQTMACLGLGCPEGRLYALTKSIQWGGQNFIGEGRAFLKLEQKSGCHRGNSSSILRWSDGRANFAFRGVGGGILSVDQDRGYKWEARDAPLQRPSGYFTAGARGLHNPGTSRFLSSNFHVCFLSPRY
jgi:hypothetical protein